MPRKGNIRRKRPGRGGAPRKPRTTSPAPRQAVLYARVSSREQEREGFSIPAQRKLLTQYAESNGLTLAQEFVDIETAKQAGRAEFGNMVAFLNKRAPRPPVVLVEKTDRIYRNLKDWVTLDEMAHLEIHLVKEGVVISDDSKSSEKFVHGIKVLMAKNYVDNLSEEVQKGMRTKAEEGHWPSSAPLGYLNRREGGKSYLVEDPERAPFIRTLFQKYDSGEYSTKGLAAYARQAGLRGKRGGVLQVSTIHHILRNPLFAGEFYWAGVLYQGKDPVLISRKLFDRVQARLDGHPYTRGVQHEFAFRGLLVCGHCGATITAERHVKKKTGRVYVYYRCAQMCEGRKFIREERISELFAGVVKKLQMTPRLLDLVRPTLKASFRNIQEETAERLADARARYDRSGGLIDAAYEDKLDGRIDNEYFQHKRQQWDRERLKIADEIERLGQVNAKTADQALNTLELANSAYSRFIRQSAQEQRVLLDTVLLNCAVNGDQLSPTFRKPFNLLEKLAACDPGDANGKGGKGGIDLKWSGREDLNLRPPAPNAVVWGS